MTAMLEPSYPSQIKAQLPPGEQHRADQAYAAGSGLAVYSAGQARILVTHSTRDSDVAGPPPSEFGEFTLTAYCPPKESTEIRQSPLKAYLNGRDIPQIAAPRRGTPHTEFPGEHRR